MRNLSIWIWSISLCMSWNVSLLSSAFSAVNYATKTTPPGQKRQRQRSLLQQLDRFLTKLQNPEEQLKNHIYLTGNYAPVSKIRIKEPVQVVEGAIPQDLDGMFCRNGPNPVYQNRLYHWFDGDAMLHNLCFQHTTTGPQAFYTNQYVPSIRHEIEAEMGEDFFPRLGEYTGFWGLLKLFLGPPMVEPIVGPDFSLAPPNTGCLLYRNKFYCLNEGNLPLECRILPDGRLERVGYETFGGTLDYPVSAHPRIDLTTGDLLFHSYAVEAQLRQQHGPMKLGTYSATEERVVTYFCPVPNQEYVSFAHNLLHTKDYMIIYDCSVHFDPKAMFEGGSFFRTNPKYNLRFGILPKTATTSDEVVWLDTGSQGGIVHPLNSWQEDDGTIVIWTPFCKDLVLDFESEDINQFSMVEFRLNLLTGKVTKEVIDDSVNVEFSVAPAMGRFIRYGYTAIQDPLTPGEGSFTGFCIWDMLKRKLFKTVYYDGLGGEPAILESMGGTIYVGAYVQKDDISYFDLYHGETTERVARLKIPGRVPYGFHGHWMKGNDLQNHFAYHATKDKMNEN